MITQIKKQITPIKTRRKNPCLPAGRCVISTKICVINSPKQNFVKGAVKQERGV